MCSFLFVVVALLAAVVELRSSLEQPVHFNFEILLQYQNICVPLKKDASPTSTRRHPTQPRAQFFVRHIIVVPGCTIMMLLKSFVHETTPQRHKELRNERTTATKRQ